MLKSLFCKKLVAVEALTHRRGNTGGLLKRIDENVEMLELLRREAPELLALNPGVTRCLASNNSFSNQLRAIVQPPEKPKHENFPRRWPKN